MFSIGMAAMLAWGMFLSDPPFSPVRWMRLELSPGQEKDLGTARLRPGGSLLVRVVDGRDGRPIESGLAHLVPEDQIGPVLERTSRAMLLSPYPEIEPGPGGWLTLYGIEPGFYLLRIEAPDGRATFSPPFALTAGEETLLPDVVLPEPAELILWLEQEDLPEAEQRLLAAAWRRVAGCNWTEVTALAREVSPGEPLVFSSLSPGNWRFTITRQVLDPEGGERSRLEMGRLELNLSPGEVRAETLTLAGRLFHGRVELGGESLEAQVELRPRAREEWQRVRVLTDPAGAFTVLLPAAGSFSARVSAPDARFSATLPDVRFEDSEREVILALPAGRVEGWVEDRDGQPLPGAIVQADQVPQLFSVAEAGVSDRPVLQSSHGQSGPDGRFELVGLAPGTWQLRAHRGSLRSRLEPVVLEEDESRAGVQLIAVEARRLRGRVSWEGQPVAGARGSVMALDGAGQPLPAVARWLTDSSGSFEAELSPEPPGALYFIVEAPGFPVAGFRRGATEDVELPLTRPGGRLEIFLPPGWREVLDPLRMGLLGEGGAWLPLGALSSLWSEEKPESGETHLILPNLSPGAWKLIHLGTEAQARAVLSASEAALPALALVTLGPGETRSIRLLDLPRDTL